MQPMATPRQMEILIFIRDYRARHGYSPTMQEIGDSLGLSKVTVFEHAGALERKGLLERGSKHSARSLRLAPSIEFPDQTDAKLPLVGRIAAGMPIEAVEERQTLDLTEVFASTVGDKFVLQVTGDSMIDEHICDGDYVICQRRNTARNGETVVALLGDGEATLKKFYRERGRIRLQPANPNYPPIYPDRVEIQGVVVGLLRVM